MRVLVTLSNILEYGLDTLTGNSRDDLLARAEEMKKDGYELYINIPDAEGGDNEIPTERNIFDHYSSDLPDPEGDARSQEAIDLSKQDYTREQVDADLSFDPFFGSPVGEWVAELKEERQCSYPGCYESAIWQRKEGWSVAPGSPEGNVCEAHHCWEPIRKE